METEAAFQRPPLLFCIAELLDYFSDMLGVTIFGSDSVPAG